MNTHSFSRSASRVLSVLSVLALSACYGSTNVDEARKRYEAKYGEHEAEKDTGIKSWLGDQVEAIAQRDQIDPRYGLSRDDYASALSPVKKPYSSEKTALSLPDVSDLMMAPEEPEIASDKLVSLAVTEDIPLKDVLMELARRADVDVQIDPNISGGIIFRVKDKTFAEVLRRICGMASLRYSVDDGVVKIERDTPYIATYRMNLLNMTRAASGSVQSGTTLDSGSGDASSGGTIMGSQNSLQTTSNTGDVWGELQIGVNNILANSMNASSVGMTSSVLSMDRSAGIISIMAAQDQHKQVKQYLDNIQIAHSSQVLIEAKVLEVSLNDDYNSGINWSLSDSQSNLSAGFNFNDAVTGLTDGLSLGLLSSPTELFGINGTSLTASVQMLEQFGVTRTLSSPRLHAMNNQQAVLTFAENYVYFTTDVQEEEDDNALNTVTTYTIDTEIQTVPVGVQLVLQPSIDLQAGEVIMQVRPTLSRVLGTETDPSIAYLNNTSGLNITSDIPVIEVKELDSILRIKSGEVMVIGGLMEERATNTDRGVPGLSKVPLVGNAFKSAVKDVDTVETVIFIKATIIPGSGVSVEDREFYNTFARERNSIL